MEHRSGLIKTGQTLVEVLVAMGLAAVLLPALLTGLVSSRQSKVQQVQRSEGIVWARKALEAVRLLVDSGWQNVANNGTYHLVASGSGMWALGSGAATVSGYTQSIVISDVLRATASGQVATSGGAIDPSSKKIEAIVSWDNMVGSAVDLMMYVTRYFDNLIWGQSTLADFNLGTNSGTAITNTNGGEVTLGAGGGGGDWCNPSLSVTSVDLSRQGVPTAVSAYPGNIVTGTGGNASGPTFVKTTVSGNSPPVATIVGQFNNSKANGVFVESNYGYIANTDHSQEIKILDLASPSGSPPTYSVVGWFDSPGSGNSQGNSVAVLNNVGYMTNGSSFYTFSLGSGDLAGHSGSRPQLNTATSVTLAGTGVKTVVVSYGGSTYAYVAVASTTTQLQVINVTDPVHPAIVASAALGNSQAGTDVAVNDTGTRAYVVTNYASVGSPDFFIVNTSSHSGSLSTVGTYNTGGMSPKGVAVVTGNRAVVVGTGGTYQYQVVNIVTETAPAACTYGGMTAGLQVAGGVFGVSSVLQNDGFAYSYIVTGDTQAELKIILGGAGGAYVNSGTYLSQILNAGTSTAFNHFQATVSQPANTSLSLQVGVAKAVGGNCAGAVFTYLGPGGDPNLYFTVGSDPTVIEGSVPLINYANYYNPGQCFRLKAIYSSTDSTAAPVLYDFNVNYSP